MNKNKKKCYINKKVHKSFTKKLQQKFYVKSGNLGGQGRQLCPLASECSLEKLKIIFFCKRSFINL